jgi:ligand-binding sensor domain-containing protein
VVAYESEAPDRHVSIFDGETFSVLVPGIEIPTELELERIAFDARGDLLLAGRGGYARKQGSEWVTTRKMDPSSPFTSVVYDIVDDGEALWIGTQSGVFERRGETVTKHDTKNLAKHLLKDGDTLWVGTYFGGVARIRGGEVTIFDEKNSRLPHDHVQGLVRAPDGVIWVHANDKVAFIRDGEIHRFE